MRAGRGHRADGNRRWPAAHLAKRGL